MSQAAAVAKVTESLMDLEHEIPGSCEALVIKILQRLERYLLFHLSLAKYIRTSYVIWAPLNEHIQSHHSSKEPKVKQLHDLAVSMFAEQSSHDFVDGKKRLNSSLGETPSLSPLAKFLLTR